MIKRGTLGKLRLLVELILIYDLQYVAPSTYNTLL